MTKRKTILNAVHETARGLHDACLEAKTIPAAVLKFLIREHDLRQSDLPEIGSQGVVSEVLTGKRELNARQIKRLAKRFNVSPAVFV